MDSQWSYRRNYLFSVYGDRDNEKESFCPSYKFQKSFLVSEIDGQTY